jgi:serine/threonine protein kinase
MATVHRAVTSGIAGFQKQVALKRMLPSVASDATLVRSFIREAQLASKLRHSNVAQTYDLGKVGDIYFIAMELVPGRTLREIVKHCIAVVGHMPLPIALNIVTQICDALDYAHNLSDESGVSLGIIHRDVSPSNIIVSEGGVVKLIDFGIAKATAIKTSTTASGTIKGKFGYMAPEYIIGADKIDARADLFALGVLMHELLANRQLFVGKDDMDTLSRVAEMPVPPPSLFNSNVPHELDSIVLTALQRNPDQRWQRASALRDALATEIRRLNLLALNGQVFDWVERAFARRATSAGEPEISIRPSTAAPEPPPPPAAPPGGRSLAHSLAAAPDVSDDFLDGLDGQQTLVTPGSGSQAVPSQLYSTKRDGPSARARDRAASSTNEFADSRRERTAERPPSAELLESTRTPAAEPFDTMRDPPAMAKPIARITPVPRPTPSPTARPTPAPQDALPTARKTPVPSDFARGGGRTQEVATAVDRGSEATRLMRASSARIRDDAETGLVRTPAARPSDDAATRLVRTVPPRNEDDAPTGEVVPTRPSHSPVDLDDLDTPGFLARPAADDPLELATVVSSAEAAAVAAIAELDAGTPVPSSTERMATSDVATVLVPSMQEPVHAGTPQQFAAVHVARPPSVRPPVARTEPVHTLPPAPASKLGNFLLAVLVLIAAAGAAAVVYFALPYLT